MFPSKIDSFGNISYEFVLKKNVNKLCESFLVTYLSELFEN